MKISIITIISITLVTTAIFADLGAASSNEPVQDNNIPQYVLEQAPFLGGKYVVYLTWRTGSISDSQNFEKNLRDNFKIYLEQSGVPENLIPEVLSTVSNVATDSKLTDNNFNPDRDKFRAEVTYDKLRVIELGSDIKVLTLPWQSAGEIDMGSPVVKSLIQECGSTDNIKALRFTTANDMSNLVSINEVSKQIIESLDSGYSIIAQNQLMPEVRNVAALSNKKFSANKSSNYNYMILGSDDITVTCVLRGISDASGNEDNSNAAIELSAPAAINPISYNPVAPVPELKTGILVSAGLLILFVVWRWNR